MKKLLVVVMMWSASLGAMEQDLLQQQQQQPLQEEMLKIEFYREAEPTQQEQTEVSLASVGEKRSASDVLETQASAKKQKTESPQKEYEAASIQVPKRYALMSPVIKNFLEDTGSDVMVLEASFKEGIELLNADGYKYWSQAYDISQKIDSNEKQKMINQIAYDLAIRSPKEVGAIGTTANFLDIAVLQEAALVACKDQLLSSDQLRQQLFTSQNPKEFNPFELNETLLMYLKEKILQIYVLEQTLRGPSGVNSVAWSPNGTTLASAASNDKTIKLWQQQNGQWVNVQTLTGNTCYVTSVAFSPDGSTLALGDDTTIKLWQQQAGQWVNVQTLSGHTSYVVIVAWSPDGKTLASGSYDKTIKLWQQQNDQLVNVYTLAGHANIVNSIAWNPDGTTLASGSGDGTVKLWQEQNDQWVNVQTLGRHGGIVNSVAWNPDGTTLAVGTHDKTIKLWQEQVGQWVNVHTLTEHRSLVDSVAWSPDGKTLASGSGDGTVKLWQKKNGRWLNVHTLTGHASIVKSVAWSPDGTTLASGSRDKTIKLWRKIPVSEMSFPQVLLVFYAQQALESNQGPLDIVQYPNLLQLYESLKELSKSVGYQALIKKLFKVANMQP